MKHYIRREATSQKFEVHTHDIYDKTGAIEIPFSKKPTLVFERYDPDLGSTIMGYSTKGHEITRYYPYLEVLENGTKSKVYILKTHRYRNLMPSGFVDEKDVEKIATFLELPYRRDQKERH